MSALVLKTPAAATNLNLPNYKDPVIPPSGMKFLFDLATPISWAKQAAPANGDPVLDIGGGAAGSSIIASGQTVAYSGRGFDWTGVTLDPLVVAAPAGVLQSIYDAANDYFMVAFYGKMPASGDWNTNATLAAMFCCTTATTGYPAETDLLMIGQQNTGALTFRRQTNGSTVDILTTAMALHYGLFAQVAFWRNASGQGARVKSAGGTTLTTAVVGSNNAGDFSNKAPRWGVTESFNAPASVAAHALAAKWRLYRGFIEDLTASGRDPVTVLDADYARTVARGVYS